MLQDTHVMNALTSEPGVLTDLWSTGGCPVSTRPTADRSCDPACTKPRSLCTEVRTLISFQWFKGPGGLLSCPVLSCGT